MAAADTEGALSFYDTYRVFPHVADDRADRRHVAEYRFARARGDGNRDSWTATWIHLDGRESDRAVIHLDCYSDSAAAFADSGLGGIISELDAAVGSDGTITPEMLTEALLAAGWIDRTEEMSSAKHWCPNCGSENYEGPRDVLNWRRRIANPRPANAERAERHFT